MAEMNRNKDIKIDIKALDWLIPLGDGYAARLGSSSVDAFFLSLVDASDPVEY